jgi:hypothetical protein
VYLVIIHHWHRAIISYMSPQEKAMAEAASFVAKLNDAILFPLIYLLGGVALLVFAYGGAVYIMNADSEQARDQGKRSIMYGLIGLVVMASAYVILGLAAGTFGLNDEVDCAISPTSTGCDTKFKI